jgi:alpha-D-xyloside xylohydrolase
MNRILKNSIYLFLLLLAADLSAQDIKWEAVAPGIWKGIVGKPEAYNLLTASGAMPLADGLKNLGDAPFPLEKSEITGKLSDGKTYLRFPLDKKEQLYGFGLNFQTVHQNP